MSDTEQQREQPAELKKTASHLVEIGRGACLRNDREGAQVYFGIAATLFEQANDTKSADQTRALGHSLK